VLGRSTLAKPVDKMARPSVMLRKEKITIFKRKNNIGCIYKAVAASLRKKKEKSTNLEFLEICTEEVVIIIIFFDKMA
jgi:hypothetical protein